jgi:hypothetical protein
VKGAKNLINTLPALATGLLCALLVVPLLSSATQHDIHGLHEWQQLNDAQTAVILAGTILSLVFLLATHGRRRGEDGEGKKHGKHK